MVLVVAERIKMHVVVTAVTYYVYWGRHGFCAFVYGIELRSSPTLILGSFLLMIWGSPCLRNARCMTGCVALSVPTKPSKKSTAVPVQSDPVTECTDLVTELLT